jgi:hypothetical protein
MWMDLVAYDKEQWKAYVIILIKPHIRRKTFLINFVSFNFSRWRRKHCTGPDTDLRVINSILSPLRLMVH